MLKDRIAQEWGDIQTQYYEEYYDKVPPYLSATWWASGLIRQLLYFSLSAWQHCNNYLHDNAEKHERSRRREKMQLRLWHSGTTANMNSLPMINQIFHAVS